MAYIQGSNTGLENCYNDLITFLTTDANLLSTGELWTQVSTYDTADTWGAGVYLRSPDINGQHFFVLISRRTYNDARHIIFQTFKDIDLTDCQTVRGGSVQLMPSQKVMITLDKDDVVSYTFVASARRITGYFESIGFYFNFYVGLFMPYTTPDFYPYPMIGLGGVNYFGHKPTSSQGEYFNRSYNKWAFIWGEDIRYTIGGGADHWEPGATTSTNDIYQGFFDEAGNRARFTGNKSDSDDEDNNVNRMWPTFYEDGGQNIYLHDTRISPGGAVPLLPCVLYRNSQGGVTPKVFGELDGVAMAPHRDVTPGDIVTDGNGHQWVIVTNGSDTWRKAAIRLL